MFMADTAMAVSRQTNTPTITSVFATSQMPPSGFT